MISRRRVSGGLFATALLVLILPPLSAEDSPSATPSPSGAVPPASASAKPAPDPSRRVPPHFAKVGLSPDQREAIYKVRAKHQEAIDAARKQLERERATMMAECEAVLTSEQKTALEQHRHGRTSEKKAPTTAGSKPESQ